MKWQPIETADKGEGRKAVLVWCPESKCVFAAWWDDWSETWEYFSYGATTINEKITHWMPLPEPPQDFSGDIGHE